MVGPLSDWSLVYLYTWHLESCITAMDHYDSQHLDLSVCLLSLMPDICCCFRGRPSQRLDRSNSLSVAVAAFGKCVRGQSQLPLQTKVECHKMFSLQLPFFRSLQSALLLLLTLFRSPATLPVILAPLTLSYSRPLHGGITNSSSTK